MLPCPARTGPTLLLALLAGGLSAPTLAAPCVELTAAAVTPANGELAAGELRFRLKLHNRCAQPYDADLTLVAVDAEGRTLHTSRDLVTLARESEVTVEKREYVPREAADQTRDLQVDIQERQRPL